MTSRIGAALMLVVLGLACPPAWAGSPTDDVRALFAGASRIMDPRAPGGLDERLGAVRGLIRDAVDFREAARLSLGPTWSARTPAERDEFVPLFAEFVERAMIAGIAGKIRLGESIKVSYLEEMVDGAVATVRTTIASRSGVDLPLDYRMIQRGGRWVIRDVVIDGVSLASNYRAQLLRVLQSASYPELVQQMRARVGGPATLPLVANATSNPASLDFIALDLLPPLPTDTRGTPERGAPPARTAPTATPSAADAPVPVAEKRVEQPAAPAKARASAEPAPADARAADRSHWLALDLTLVARIPPESAPVSPSPSAPTSPPAEHGVKSAEPARAGDLAKYAELIDLVARTRPAESSRSTESPKPVVLAKPRDPATVVPPTPPAVPAKPRDPASTVPPMPQAVPARSAEPTRLASLTEPSPAGPAARPIAVEQRPLAALPKPSGPPRLTTPLRPVRLEPESAATGQRAPEAPSATAQLYWVQVGAFKTVDAAQRLVDELIGQGAAPASSVVVAPASSDVPWARVRVGPFPDRWAAASKVREMQAIGHTPFVAGPRD